MFPHKYTHTKKEKKRINKTADYSIFLHCSASVFFFILTFIVLSYSIILVLFSFSSFCHSILVHHVYLSVLDNIFFCFFFHLFYPRLVFVSVFCITPLNHSILRPTNICFLLYLCLSANKNQSDGFFGLFSVFILEHSFRYKS